MKQERLIIHTTADTLLEMFEILKELPPELDTEQVRIQILYMLGQSGAPVSIFKTKRSKKKIVADLRKQYGQVSDLTDVHEGGKGENEEIGD